MKPRFSLVTLLLLVGLVSVLSLYGAMRLSAPLPQAERAGLWFEGTWKVEKISVPGTGDNVGEAYNPEGQYYIFRHGMTGSFETLNGSRDFLWQFRENEITITYSDGRTEEFTIIEGKNPSHLVLGGAFQDSRQVRWGHETEKPVISLWRP